MMCGLVTRHMFEPYHRQSLVFKLGGEYRGKAHTLPSFEPVCLEASRKAVRNFCDSIVLVVCKLSLVITP